MIIIQLMGGLGNQMFQYSFGRNLALVKNVEFKLDTSGYERDGKRTYRLHKFNIVEHIASSEEIKGLKQYNHLNMYSIPFFLREKFRPYYRRRFVKEQTFEYDPDIRRIPDDAYLSGYWQTEKYFSEIRDILKSEFTLKECLDERNLDLLSGIRSHDSVSLHIRRGDYVSDSATNKYHGTCSLRYYQNAIDLLSQSVDRPYFFIFSDEMKWVESNFPIGYDHEFVSHNGEVKDYIDMILMMNCRHHILANSSFSWWGAWLGEYEETLTIAPKQWYQDPGVQNNDLLPQSWHRI